MTKGSASFARSAWLASSTVDLEWDAILLGSSDDHLVDGIVPADVLAHGHGALGVEQRRAAQAAGAREDLLRGA